MNKNKIILLVQPKVGYIDKLLYGCTPPLALLTLKQVLVDNGYKVIMLDQRITKDWKKALSRIIRNDILCVGITSITGIQIKYALEISRYIKNRKSIPIIFGGIHASMMPEQTLANKYVDIVVSGEAEETFPELAEALLNRKSLNNIKGLAYKENKKIKSNRQRMRFNLENSPLLNYNNKTIRLYTPLIRGKRTIYLESSRGCPNNCSFCYNSFYFDCKWNSKSVEKIVDEIKYYNKHFNISSFRFVDPNFFVCQKRVMQFCKSLIKNRINITWDAQGTLAQAIDYEEEFLRLMERSGCRLIVYGIESASREMQKLINKPIDVEKLIDFNKRIARYNIIPEYNFMSGFPGERIKDIKQNVDLILRLTDDNKKAFISEITILMPFPKTPIYDICLDYGLESPKTIEGWIRYDSSNPDQLKWLSKKRKELLKRLQYLSLFIDREAEMYGAPLLIRVFSFLYRPIARKRLKNMQVRYMLMIHLNKIFLRLMSLQG